MSRPEFLNGVSRTFKKIQVICQIELGPEDLKKVLDKLREDEGLVYCSHDVSKLEVFRLKEDPRQMLQISSRGKVVMTVESPEGYRKMNRALYEAIWDSGFSSYVLSDFKAKIYRVEEYNVNRFEDVRSLLIAQTILGVRRE